MTFYEYMMEKYLSGEGRKHDLAADMDWDGDEFPKQARWEKGSDEGRLTIKRHLEICGACDACMDVFEECWREYARCEKKRSRKSSSGL